MNYLTIPNVLLLGVMIGSAGTQTAQANLAEGLLAYWPFDDNTADLMGTYHAVPVSDSVTLKEGKFGKAVSFDGSAESYLDIVNANDSDLEVVGSSKTVSIWISPDQLQSSGNAVAFSRRGLWYWEVYYNPVSRAIGYYADNARDRPKYVTSLERGEWAHVVGVSDGDEEEDRIYFNGELVSVATFVDDLATYNDDNVKRRFHIGRSANERDRPWSGLVDDVAVWDRVLTGAEVATLWNEGEGRALGAVHDDANTNDIPDFWEAAYELDGPAESDADGDGYTNLEEYRQGTNPVSGDSDGDGLTDAVESGTGVWIDANDTGTSPYLVDSDADRFPDAAEDPSVPYIGFTQPGTDPNRADSDGDGLTDDEEFLLGTDPTVPAPATLKYLTGLIAYWPFDDSLETTRSFENVEVRVEMSNDATATFGPGQFGNGIKLDGFSAVTAESVDPDGNDLFAFPKQSFSISGWWKSTRFNGEQQGLITSGGEHPWYLVEKGSSLLFQPSTADAVGSSLDGIGISSDGFPVELVGSEQRFRFGGLLVTDGRLRLNRMHHVASVYNTRTGQFATYLDGTKLGIGDTRTGGTALRNDKLWIGSSFGRDFWEGTIDDVAIWSRTLSEVEIDAIYNDGRGRPLSELLSEDKDEDGMPDDWETANGLNPLVDDRASDLDGDGLTNIREFELRTLPNNEDTDEDGLTDGVETLTTIFVDSTDTGTDPRIADTDSDGYLDGVEISEVGTNPNLLDSDGDGLSDPTEVSIGSDPNDPNSSPNLASRLKAYWPFDGDLLDKQAAFHGIGRGDESLTFVDTDRGQAVSLDGISQYIEFQDSAENFDFVDQSFSVSLWYTPETYEGIDIRQPPSDPIYIYREMQASIIGKGGGFGRGVARSEDAWSIERDDSFSDFPQGGVRITTQSEKAFYQGSAAQFIMGQPNHLLLVVDSVVKRQRFYLNGKRIGSKPLKRFAPNAVPLMIGLNPNDTQRDLLKTDQYPLHPFIKGVIDDVAIWDRPLVDDEVDLIASSSLGIEALLGRPDKDKDGVDDTWEVFYGLDPESDDTNGDFDADGLTNLEEYILRTDPTSNDTDGDGLIDSVETASGRWVSLSDTGTDPIRIDTDGDGYSDAIERPDLGYASVIQPGTDPNRKDTDGDGTPDGEESAAGADPTNADNTPSNFQVTAEWGAIDDGGEIDDAFAAFIEEREPLLIEDLEAERKARTEDIGTYSDFRQSLKFRQTYPLPAINISTMLGPSIGDRFPNNLNFVAQDEGVDNGALFMEVSGTFTVTTPGEWTFGVNAKQGGDLRIDGERVAVAGLAGSAMGSVELTAGLHQIDFYVWDFFSGRPGRDWQMFAEVFVALEPGKFEAFEDASFVLLRPSATEITPVERELIVQEFERSLDDVRIQWASEPNTLYNVEYSRTLIGPWDVIARDLEATTFQTTWNDADPERLGNPTAFYRVGLASKDL